MKKEKKTIYREELIHIIIKIIRFTEMTVFNKQYNRFYRGVSRNSSVHAINPAASMQIFGGAKLKHMFHFRVKKKKRTFNPRSMIYDCLGNVSRISVASGPVALPCFLAISQNHGIKFQPTAFGGNKGVNLVPARLICCPNRCAIIRGISGAKQFVLQI